MSLPDRLLLYGDYWRRELATDSFWGDSLRVVGSPRIDKYRSRGTVRPPDRCTVLFTTQGIDVHRVADFLRLFLAELRRRVPVRLIIKLHPMFDQDKNAYIEPLSSFADDVEVWGGEEGLSTFELMRDANLHLSISSASHYDAIGLGVPTVILPFPPREIVEHLHRAGHAMLVEAPGDLCNLALGWRDLRVPQNVSEYYFEPNALTNIRRELEWTEMAS